ncbi:MAG: alpha/beta hydrolase [Chloroflexota bacterium]|nr:alpha/beta hydrolase [Chloroflexota bacterium]
MSGQLPKEAWAESRGARIHYLDSGGSDTPDFTPLVYIPGGLGSAEEFRSEMAVLAPRRCLSISLRGRGKSDAPNAGYSFDHHVTDIESVIDQSGLGHCCLMAYSMSVPYAIAYAARHPRRLSGLIIIDYPARYPAIPPEWADQVIGASPEGPRPQAVRGVQRESGEVLLWDRLSEIGCPTLVLRGGKPGSLLTAEATDMYRRLLDDVRIVVFEESGHELWVPDYGRFMRTIADFLRSIDRSSPGP